MHETWEHKLHPTTIIHAVLDSNAPRAEKSFEHLWQNGQLFILAGTVTAASTLSVIVLHLLDRPFELRNLREELRLAISDPDGPFDLVVLEQLPYLGAVVREGLRLANGLATRLPRIDPEKPTIFIDRFKNLGKQYIIPAGTPMSMTSMLIHYDMAIYDDPKVFKPGRWLADRPPADKYFHPFTKGTRQCLGINLAYAELYLTIARIFRSYGSQHVRMEGDRGYLELYKTTTRNIEIVADGFVPIWPKESEGIQILVRT
jgi:cytochrome P450